MPIAFVRSAVRRLSIRDAVVGIMPVAFVRSSLVDPQTNRRICKQRHRDMEVELGRRQNRSSTTGRPAASQALPADEPSR
jgi:hypothetical protein